MRFCHSAATTAVLMVFWVSVVAAHAAEGDAPAAKASGAGIVPADAKLELLFTRTAKINGGLTEGAAVAPDGSIYFSDIPVGMDKGQILRFDPATGKTTVFSADSGKANGLMFDAQGRLV
ncbi:MAG TPA: hypothetical protein VHB99_06080, partial [Pirellulales bacterium]|nr:hypothetical protein [Pirellulales bacterium]